MKSIAEHINTLARFCGKRDVKSLDRDSLYEEYGIEIESTPGEGTCVTLRVPCGGSYV